MEVLVGGYSSYCSAVDNNCSFQFSALRSPRIDSIEPSNTQLSILGEGFDSTSQISIGQYGWCQLITVKTTSIVRQLLDGPCGRHSVDVNVPEKGFASKNQSFLVEIPLVIRSFDPQGGQASGGYAFTLNGTGFSSSTLITIDGNSCKNVSPMNFTSITCTVPASQLVNSAPVVVSAIDGRYSSNASSFFTYTTGNVPRLMGIEPNVVTVQGGIANITGSGVVLVGTIAAQLLSWTNNSIQINLPSLPPGRYPIRVNTSMGFARPLIEIEYRFYLQQVSPQVGSLYGGSDVYIQGQGFTNDTRVQFRDETNRRFPCPIISTSSNQILCRSTSSAPQMIIQPNGVYPIAGPGLEWTPKRVTVQQGTVVTWQWNSSALQTFFTYKIQKTSNAYSSEPPTDGFDSGSATSIGKVSD